MSNSVERATPRYEQQARLRCSKRLLQGLEEASAYSEQICDELDIATSGLTWDYDEDDDTLYPYFDDGVYLFETALADIAALGAIIAANGMEYMQFGMATTCDKMLAAGFGGTEFRIYADGMVTWAELVFPEDGKPDDGG